MLYRGYTIRKTPYPTKYAPNAVGFDILDDGRMMLDNIDTSDNARYFIDLFIKRGLWADKERKNGDSKRKP